MGEVPLYTKANPEAQVADAYTKLKMTGDVGAVRSHRTLPVNRPTNLLLKCFEIYYKRFENQYTHAT